MPAGPAGSGHLQVTVVASLRRRAVRSQALCVALAESTITAKVQATVAVDVRAWVNARPGTRWVWSARPDGPLIVRTRSRATPDVAGKWQPPQAEHVSAEEMFLISINCLV